MTCAEFSRIVPLTAAADSAKHLGALDLCLDPLLILTTRHVSPNGDELIVERRVNKSEKGRALICKQRRPVRIKG